MRIQGNRKSFTQPKPFHSRQTYAYSSSFRPGVNSTSPSAKTSCRQPGHFIVRSRIHRSADFPPSRRAIAPLRRDGGQSAVSRVSNPQGSPIPNDLGFADGLPTGSRRYSRLETCATKQPSLGGIEAAMKYAGPPPKEVYHLPSFEHGLTQSVLTHFAHLQSFLAAANSVKYGSAYIA